MKKSQTDEAAKQTKAGLNRKGILVFCLLLGCGLIISVIVLGSSIIRFSKVDVHVIPLVPPEAAYSESEEKASSGDSNPQTKPAREESSAAAGTTNYITDQSGEYRGELRVYDGARTWSSETHVDLFKSSYDGTVKSEDEEKVIAPGTTNSYHFTVKNNGDIPLDYAISLKVDTRLGDEAHPEIPLEWRLLSDDGAAVTDWKGYNERTETLKRDFLGVRNQDQYTIEWRWTFERGEGMDEADTDMGNIAVDQAIGVNAAIYVYAEQSASWDGKPSSFWDTPKTGDSFNVLLYIVLAAASACGLLTVVWIRGKEDKD